jgi:hypothetical protein
MNTSFKSWNSLSEAIAKGKDTLIDPKTGKKHKITYKVQNTKQFVLKVINDIDLIDSSTNRLMPDASAAIKNYFNDEDQFTMAIGQLTPSFFKNKFIVYKILRDGELFGRTKQKIQFNIEDRLDPEGKPKYPTIDQSVEFIDADSFKAAEKSGEPVVQNIIQTAQQTTLPDPAAPEEATPTTTTDTSTSVDKGKKFLYTMRTNSKLYLMEFTEKGALVAKTRDGSDPNGEISYDSQNKKVLWNTKLDDSISKDAKLAKEKGTPLFYDMEITQSQDKTFLEKIFTDPEFRKKIISEYEREYSSSELTPENLRKMLFYKNGNPIFAQPATSAETGVNQAKIDSIAGELANALTSQNLTFNKS